ncbi:MAG TPA: type I restriction enzyme HsdR N-terminal domain-containing protein [Niabella sp.]|nr:type I restriction enzyme HsdR N-terminal domain-containing protein [Niabella sp.]HOZ97741.1 type I restriction enzyme HsdR N-terminal domain-containing protein [Niabella sp.]HQW14056.1 type I restriction enzyme HsdR N-terminal domain-containing protein [Niabella sp.]HQX19401.1 type I restriction enzyme HsdR N-terminal domain-containing protein [Niabella sp.]HQX40246.1 type I restriction enzyme HsdR N-terminal domain-containing protein [Niabella sp.]
MILIEYPKPDFKIEFKNNQPFIFDPIRRKWLVLQDEEWVRQNFVHYLLLSKQYPQSLIALEKEIQLGSLKKRFDILVYDPVHQPWMLVECKSQKVPITEKTLLQILRYHITMPAKYLILTNGLETYGWQKIDGKLIEIDSLPEFLPHH